jgi:hypothetical protein
MTYIDSPCESERFAQSLLAAWNSGDVPCLRNELKQIAAADSSSLPAFEGEKMELVQGVAQTMRLWLGGTRGKRPDLNIALALLRHVATPKNVAAWSGCPASKAQLHLTALPQTPR